MPSTHYYSAGNRSLHDHASRTRRSGRESKHAVSDEFDGLDAIEKAAMEAALNRCRALVRQIQSKLRNKRPEHFVDKLSLADFCASVEKAADVLKQRRRQSVRTRSAPAAKGSKARSRQRHR